MNKRIPLIVFFIFAGAIAYYYFFRQTKPSLSQKNCQSFVKQIDDSKSCEEKSLYYIQLIDDGSVDACSNFANTDSEQNFSLRDKVFDITKCFETDNVVADENLKRIIDVILNGETWETNAGPFSNDAQIELHAFKERWIDKIHPACRNHEDYLIFLKNALNGQYEELSGLVWSENNFIMGVLNSNNLSRRPIASLIGELSQENRTENQSISVEFSIGRIIGWHENEDLFFIPGLKNSCWFLYGAFTGPQDLTLDELSRSVPKMSGVPLESL